MDETSTGSTSCGLLASHVDKNPQAIDRLADRKADKVITTLKNRDIIGNVNRDNGSDVDLCKQVLHNDSTTKIDSQLRKSTRQR